MEANRILIYYLKNENQILESCDIFFLKELSKKVNRIFFLSDAKMNEKALYCTKDISNIEIKHEIIFNDLKKYEEVIFSDNCLIGPFFDLDFLFRKMKTFDVDFWGLAKSYGINSNYKNQSSIVPNFIVFNNNENVRKFFNNKKNSLMNLRKNFAKIICNASQILKFDTFTDRNNEFANLCDYPFTYCSYRYVKYYKCPFILKESFNIPFEKIIKNSSITNISLLIDYLKLSSKYDVSLIFNFLLKNLNNEHIVNNLCYRFVLPSKSVPNKQHKKIKVALFFHIYYVEYLDRIIKYIYNFRKYGDIYVTTTSEDKRNSIISKTKKISANINVLVSQNRGRDLSSLLVCNKDRVKNYDLVCFAHDKKSPHIKNSLGGEMFAEHCLENILGTSEYIQNIINLFIENKNIGIAAPFNPYFGTFIDLYTNYWCRDLNNTQELLYKLGINIDLSCEKEPIAPLGTMFWFKPMSLNKIFNFNWKYEDFPLEPMPDDGTISHAIERSFGYVAKYSGYCFAYIVNNNQASATLSVLNFLLLKEMRKNEEFVSGRNKHKKIVFKIKNLIRRFIRKKNI